MSLIKEYETEDLIVYWRPEICQHAAKCVHGAPKVFEVGRSPWIDVKADKFENIIKVIDQCPSGALTYKIKNK